jgi:chromosome segregation ATPase
MKKGFFGYNVSEVDVMLNTLREENESLNATITTLKSQIKNNETGGAKANLLEADLKNREESIKNLNEENNELKHQVSSLTAEYSVLTDQNTELMKEIEELHKEKENLNIQIFGLQQQVKELKDQTTNVDTSFLESLQVQLESEKEYRTVLEQALNSKAEELTAATLDLEEVRTSYESLSQEFDKEKTQELIKELELAQMEISQLKDELAIAKLSIDEQAKMKVLEKKQQANLNLASEISFRAYYDMSKLRNEVVEYMQEQMKEYYQSVNENSVKMRAAIEQRQTEYNQMIRDFNAKASDFRVGLSNMEDKYNDMADYSMNIDKLSNRMNEIMNNFIDTSNACLKKKEGETISDEECYNKEKAPINSVEKSNNKPLVFKVSGQ